MHRDINSHVAVVPGECLDAERGEWAGVNEAVARLSQGRTTRVRLHSLEATPHTGCG